MHYLLLFLLQLGEKSFDQNNSRTSFLNVFLVGPDLDLLYGCYLPVDSFDHLDPLDTAETFLVARHCVI